MANMHAVSEYRYADAMVGNTRLRLCSDNGVYRLLFFFFFMCTHSEYDIYTGHARARAREEKMMVYYYYIIYIFPRRAARSECVHTKARAGVLLLFIFLY